MGTTKETITPFLAPFLDPHFEWLEVASSGLRWLEGGLKWLKMAYKWLKVAYSVPEKALDYDT